MKFIGYMKCSTCIKALKLLKDNNIEVEVVDIKSNTPTSTQLKEIHQKTGLDINKLFNTSGLVYKELGLKDKLSTLSNDEKFELLASNGMLIKRPLLVTSEKALIGFKENDYLQLIHELK